MKTTLSVTSALNLFKDCPRCFWLAMNGKSRPSGIFPSLPSGMDIVLKKYFDKHRANGTVPDEIKETKAKLFSDNELLEVWKNNRKGLRWEDPKTGFTLMGAVDEILIKGKKLIVLDFKTRGFPLKEDTAMSYADQLATYVFLLRKNGYDVEDKAYLLFYHPLEVKGKSVDFNTDLVEIKVNVKDAEKLFKDAVKCLLGKEPKKHEECKWCNW